PGQPVTLGRSRDNTVIVRDELASRLHAKIYFEDGHWHLRDFGLNGTRLDGVRVNGAVELEDGGQVQIGEVVLRFTTHVKAGAKTETPPPAAPTVVGSHIRLPAAETHHGATKVHEFPTDRVAPSESDPDVTAKQLRMDDLTALCKFMTGAVETPTPHDLITLALRTIL